MWLKLPSDCPDLPIPLQKIGAMLLSYILCYSHSNLDHLKIFFQRKSHTVKSQILINSSMKTFAVALYTSMERHMVESETSTAAVDPRYLIVEVAD